MDNTLYRVVRQFRVDGNVLEIKPYGNGHINITFLVITDQKRYILQKINQTLFKDVDKLMNNIYLVTTHIKENFPNKQTLTIIKTKDDKIYLQDVSGDYRLYEFIENTVCLQIVSNENEFYESACAFGEFANMLATFDAKKLYEILPNFHNTKSRFNDFIRAVDDNVSKRKNNVLNEIEFVNKRKEYCNRIVSLLDNKQMPLKVTHNDTKLNNVLLDEKTFKGVAVIDLDTVMPGSICYDFGDSIRFGCNSSYEDDPNLNNVYFRIDLFEKYVDGYLKMLNKSISTIEKDNLAFGAILMTYECGMRFLTDYLNGDTYFKTKYPNHNLDRCHTQFKLVSDMEDNLDKMNEIVNKYYKMYCM